MHRWRMPEVLRWRFRVLTQFWDSTEGIGIVFGHFSGFALFDRPNVADVFSGSMIGKSFTTLHCLSSLPARSIDQQCNEG